MSYEQEEPKITLSHGLTMLGVLGFCLGCWAIIIWLLVATWSLVHPFLPFTT